MSDALQLLPATPADLAFVAGAEADPDNARWIIAWPEARHRKALADPDQEYLMLDAGEAGPVGYAMLAGLVSPHGSVELRRLVVTVKRRGHGRRALLALVQRAFATHRAHRLWLDVKAHNQPARSLYLSEGFRVEGTLRECLLGPEGYESLVVMALLAREWAGRAY